MLRTLTPQLCPIDIAASFTRVPSSDRMDPNRTPFTASTQKRANRLPTSRSCDSCYALKSRCVRPTPGSACNRCAKLSLRCADDRPPRRPGPKPPKFHPCGEAWSPSSGSPGSPTVTVAEVSESAPRTEDVLALSGYTGPLSSALQELSSAEIRLLEFAFSTWFINTYMSFNHGQDELREVLVTSFIESPELAKDPILACAGAIASRYNYHLIDATPDINIRRASSSLVCVRTLPANDYHNLSKLIDLATGLATFSLYALGESTQWLLWYVFSCITEVENGDETQPFLSLNRNTGCVLFLHHFECLLRSEIPAYRVREGNNFPEDRYYGISFSILPLLNDLCRTAYRVRLAHDEDKSLASELAKIIEKLMNWKPQLTMRTLGARIEGLMSAQARCLQRAAIIMACRYSQHLEERFSTLQHSLSLQVQNDVHQMYEDMPDRSGNLYVTFPYYIACLGLRDDKGADHLLTRFNDYCNHSAPATCRKMYNFLRYVWKRGASNGPEAWAVVYEAGPPLAVTC